MKTSEEKLDEALRAALKRKFDHFEDQPNPSSYRIIRAHLKQPRSYRFLFFTILFIGVFVAGIKLDQDWIEKARPVSKKEIKRNLPQEVSGIVTNRIETNLLRQVSVAETNQTKSNLPLQISKKEIKRNLPQEVSGIATNRTETNLLRQVSVIATNRTETNLLRQVSVAETNQTKSNLPRQISKNKINRNLPQQVSGTTPNLPQQVSGTTPNLAKEVSLLPASISELEPEQMKLTSLTLPGVYIPEAIAAQHAIHTNPQKISWLFNVAGLKTYQILTVPKSGGQNFQNFKFPSAFSLESIGYKISTGFEKKGFQFLLNYSTLRQNYSYEIAGDEYVVEAAGKASYKLVRPGTVVTENTKMDLIGIGVNKQVEWGRSLFQQYYASAGLEYSRTLKTGRSIGWINAGFGKQFVVNRTALLNIEPYAEFSPAKVSGAENPFLYQPYRVGISVGLKFIRH